MDDGALTRALMHGAAYPHAAPGVRCIETHLSRVFLAGEYAYKVRKPVRFDFVDFSTLAARRADCEEELRLNRRLAGALYLDVVPIAAVAGGAGGHEDREADGNTPVRLGGSGPALDYAVRMRRFAQHDLLAARVQAGNVNGAMMDALGRRLADFHADAPRCGSTDATDYGTPARVAATLEECLQGVARLADADGAKAIQCLGRAMRSEALRLAPAMAARRRSGHVRECHGDLHLGNVVVVDGEALPFDCLEFNAGLRWIDSISDTAFLYMDLIHHGRRDLAYRFLNAYLERGGDYAGLGLLPFYAALRALVRARVGLERRHQCAAAGADAAPAAGWRALLELAETLLSRRRGAILLMHGLSGSGKSTVAARLAERGGMVRVRADVERKRPGAPPAGGWYAPAAGAATYRRLLAACRLGACAGFPMIADATFLARARRECFAAQAARLRLPFVIVHCEATVDTLRARISARAQARNDPSDADLEVLGRQLREQEPLCAAELRATTSASDADTLAARFA